MQQIPNFHFLALSKHRAWVCVSGVICVFIAKIEAEVQSPEDQIHMELIYNTTRKTKKAVDKEELGKIQYEHCERQKTINQGRKVKKAEAAEHVADLLGQRKTMVAEVWRDYLHGNLLFVVNSGGNHHSKSTQVPRACLVATMVQYFVREWQQTHQRTVARDVMDFFDGCGYITVDQENKKDVNAALRSMHCYLCHIGYRQGKKKGMQHYKLREENLQKCDEYVQFMIAVNQDPTRQ
eukprot:14235296-Ditylum_brightwellii.AAC.1